MRIGIYLAKVKKKETKDLLIDRDANCHIFVNNFVKWSSFT